MNNNDENNERNSEIKVEATSFNVREPLDDEQRALMYGAIINDMENFRRIDELYNERFPETIPDRNVKRAFAMASKMAEFVIDFLEKSGCCINMDSDAMQAVLTPLLLPGPVIACDAMSEIDSYAKEKRRERK